MAPVAADSIKQFGTQMPQGGHPPHHSITSSARASSDGGTVRPSALAVVRLMTSSNLVGCSTGMSPGLAPRRILSTKSAATEPGRVAARSGEAVDDAGADRIDGGRKHDR